MKYLLFLIYSLPLSLGVKSEGEPEHPNCEWNTGGTHIQRMRDLSDCRYFYYCAGKNSEPMRDMCPQYGKYTLHYNPKTTVCDYEEFGTEWCLPEPTTTTEASSEEDEETTTEEPTTEEPTTEAPTTTTTEEPTTEEPTTEASSDEDSSNEDSNNEDSNIEAPTTEVPTTTSAPPAPSPSTHDKFDNVNCEDTRGIFANPENCSTFIFCRGGKKIVKNCNDGQLFDTNTEECQPAEKAQCYEEVNLDPHQWQRGHERPYHGYKPTKPFSEDGTSVTLQNPVVTNWGTWQDSVECGKGMFAIGLNVWREMIKPGKAAADHAGITQISLACQTPGGNETDYIESIADGASRGGWPRYYWCKGAMVGFQLNSVKPKTHLNPLKKVDEIATDNVKGYCSASKPVMKPYDDPVYAPQHTHRGVWTKTQFCKKYQAVCGMQAQMHNYKDKKVWKNGDDNKGLNNLKIKCCTVPNPSKNCNVEEKKYFVRECDNSENGVRGNCEYDSMVGLVPDYEMDMKRIIFYSSLGYEFDCIKDEMRTRIGEGLAKKFANGENMQFSWDQRTEQMESDEVITEKNLFVEPRQKVELFQIVGKCGHILMRSNRYVKITKDASGNAISEDYFDV